MAFVFQCCLLPFRAVTLYVQNVLERHRKITTFPQTRKGINDISIIGSFLSAGVHTACLVVAVVPSGLGLPLVGLLTLGGED